MPEVGGGRGGPPFSVVGIILDGGLVCAAGDGFGLHRSRLHPADETGLAATGARYGIRTRAR